MVSDAFICRKSKKQFVLDKIYNIFGELGRKKASREEESIGEIREKKGPPEFLSTLGGRDEVGIWADEKEKGMCPHGQASVVPTCLLHSEQASRKEILLSGSSVLL